MKKIPRRVVTGVCEGRSCVVEDSLVNNVSEDFPNLVISDIWQTSNMPAHLDFEAPIANTAFPTVIKEGTYARYVHIPPDRELGVAYDPLQKAEHPLMHATNSLDYILIVSGELYLITDTEETLLMAGDIVIQRGTRHAWSNRSSQPCIQFAVLIDAII